VTTVQRDARSGTLMTWLAALLGLALAIGALVALVHGKLNLAVLARVAAGMAGFWLAMVWSMLFIPGSVLINSAVNARLLPRQRRRLMQMAVIGWLLCTLALAVVLESWAVVPIGGFYLIGLPLMLAGHRSALVLVIIACNWPILSRNVLPKPLVETLASAPSVLALTVLLLPAGVFALRLLYPAGGDAWLARRDAQVKRIQRFANGQGSKFTDDFSGATGSHILRLYGAMLRRDCRKRDPATLLMHALGPVAHWSAWIGSMGMALVIGIGVRALLVLGDAGKAHDTVTGIAAGASGVLAMLVLFSTVAFGQQLRRTHGEQALLRLTPLAGDAALLNRRLAAGLFGRTLQIWLMQVVVVLAVTWLIGGDGQAMLRQFSLCCLAGQVALIGLQGDFAREAGWNWTLGLWAALVATLEGAVAAGLGSLAGPSAWPWLIVIAVVGAAVQVRLDWRRMLAAPVAFPAGRMAS
jgi:hypothetical protein